MSKLPQFAEVFKREVARVVRRELRRELMQLGATLRRQRALLKALKQKCAALERDAASAAARRPAAAPALDAATKARLSGGLIMKLRKRHGLSRLKFAKLLGISTVTVKSWESDKARPRAVNRARLVAMRRHSTASLKKLLAANKTVWEA